MVGTQKKIAWKNWTRLGLIIATAAAARAVPAHGAITFVGDHTALPWTSATNVVIGNNGYGSMTMDSGQLMTVNTFTAGNLAAGVGFATITGTNTKLTVTGTVYSGDAGYGSVHVESGATLKANSIQASVTKGDSQSAGIFAVSGANSLLDVTTNAFISVGGNGLLSVTNQGKVNIGGNLSFGYYAGSVSSLLLQDTNSKITANSVTTGSGQSDLDILNGASLVTDEAIIGAAGKAIVTVGGGATWTNTGNFSLGGTAKADFQVGANSTAALQLGFINGTDGARGHLIASGNQAKITYNYLYVGDSGSGTLTSQNGAQVTGGYILTGTSVGGHGYVNIDGGTIDSGGVYFGYVKGGYSNADITNGGKLKTTTLVLGNGGSSYLNVSNGTVDVSGDTVMASAANSSSTLLMTGSNSKFNTNNLAVGVAGIATVTVDDHAHLKSKSASVGGQGGSGTVNLTNGGVWESGDLMIGSLNDVNDGHVLISNNSTLRADMFILRAGGDLTLLNGNLSFSDAGYVSSLAEINFYSGKIEWRGDHTFVANENINKFLNNSSKVKVGQELSITGKADFMTPFEIDGGKLSVGTMGTGQVVFTRGTFQVMDDGFTVGNGGVFGNTLNVRSDTRYIAQYITNNGMITGNGDVVASIINTTSGRIQVGLGNRLHLGDGGDYSNHTNAGLIELNGGTIHFDGTLENKATGMIKGYGTLQVDNPYDSQGLTNKGSIYLTGNAGVIGNVNNTNLISLSGTSPNVFYNNVKNNGEIRVSEGSQAIFLGVYSGAGQITGGGKTFFEGGLNPGNSPAKMQVDGNVKLGSGSTLDIEIGGLLAGSQHDKIEVTGNLELGGTLRITLYDLGSGVFAPQLGDSFDILDWGTLTGNFSNIQFAPLSGGLGWDLSQLYTTGVISVGTGAAVPEPASLAVLALGGLGLMLRRAKRA